MQTQINDDLIKKIKRGRPPKISVEKECIDKPNIKRGRPKIIEVDKKTYQKDYYETNKEKTKGDILCETCMVYHSKSNKTRHYQSKYHKNNFNLCKSIGNFEILNL